MDKVAKHLFLFEGDGVVRDFQGTFSEYLDYRREYTKPTVSWAVLKHTEQHNVVGEVFCGAHAKEGGRGCTSKIRQNMLCVDLCSSVVKYQYTIARFCFVGVLFFDHDAIYFLL